MSAVRSLADDLFSNVLLFVLALFLHGARIQERLEERHQRGLNHVRDEYEHRLRMSSEQVRVAEQELQRKDRIIDELNNICFTSRISTCLVSLVFRLFLICLSYPSSHLPASRLRDAIVA